MAMRAPARAPARPEATYASVRMRSADTSMRIHRPSRTPTCVLRWVCVSNCANGLERRFGYPNARHGMKALGVDVGGTFTDFVLFDTADSTVVVYKTSSGEDTALGVAEGIRHVLEGAGAQASDVELLIHGTTVATN